MNVADYAVVVLPLSDQDGGGFAAHVPDLPGCMSDGETQEEAILNARDAIECWIEAATDLGRAIPAPGDSIRKVRKRDAALLEALQAALKYADDADSRIAVLEEKVEALVLLMKSDEGAAMAISGRTVVANLSAPCH